MTPSARRVEELLTELGLADKVNRVADNIWTLPKGSAMVQIVAAAEFVVATAKLVDGIPAHPGEREKFFRLLLEENVQLLGAFFTLEQNESVRINQVLPVDWLQARELAFIVGNVASKADEWDDRLRALLK
jgi:hypothetical protein